MIGATGAVSEAATSDAVTSDVAKPDAAPGRGYAWYVVAALTTCYTLSFIDRQILSLLVQPIKADLKASDTQVGLLGGFAFSVFYTFLGLPLGRLVDRYNRRNIIAVGVMFWSLMTAACALSRGFGGLFLARMGVGVGEATLGPAAVSMISDSFPRTRLASAMSVYGMGIYLGSGLALLVGGAVIQLLQNAPAVTLPLLGDLAAWRVTFLVVGLPGLLVAAWVATLREPPRGGALRGADGRTAVLSVRETVAELRRRWSSVGGIALGMMVQAVALYAFLLWSPATMQRLHGWSPQQTGFVLGATVLIGGCLGMFAGGAISDRWQRAGRRDAAIRLASFSCLAAAVAAAALLAALPSSTATAALFFPIAVALAMPTGSCFAASQMILPNQVRGQGIALILFVANLGGLTLGPLLPGLLNDYAFKSERALGMSLALTIAISAAVAAGLFAATRAAYRRHHALLNA